MVAKETTSVTGTGTTGRSAGPRGKTPVARPTGEAGRRLAPPSIATFFVESRAELRKVTWPDRQTVTNLTLAVIGMTVGVAAFLGIIDEILNYVISPIIGTK